MAGAVSGSLILIVHGGLKRGGAGASGFWCHKQGSANLDRAASDHPGEDPFPGHNAVAHPLVDGTVLMAFLADLGDLKQCVPQGKKGSRGKVLQIGAFNDQVLAEGAGDHASTLLVELIDFGQGEDAHLAVPGSGMGVSLDPVSCYQQCTGDRCLGGSPPGAGADAAEDPGCPFRFLGVRLGLMLILILRNGLRLKLLFHFLLVFSAVRWRSLRTSLCFALMRCSVLCCVLFVFQFPLFYRFCDPGSDVFR